MSPRPEQRAFPRLPVHLAVRYSSGAELASSFIDSVSLGGVFIRTSRPLPIGTEITLDLQLDDARPSDPPIRIRGRVVSERLAGRTGGMGVEFLDPPPDRLRKLLTSRPA